MNIGLLQIVQWLHILFGITWVGGYVFLTFAVYPTLLKRPAAEAKAFFAAMGKPTGTLMMISGSAVMLLGLIRGIVFGPIRSLELVLTTPYGLTFLTALVVTIFLSARGAREGDKIIDHIWEGDQFRPGAATYLRNSNAVNLIGFAVVVACMVLMRFGM